MLTRRGYAVLGVIPVVAGTAFLGGVMVAMPTLMTLDRTVAEVLDATEAGDLRPALEADPDCPPVTEASLAKATKAAARYNFRVVSIHTVEHNGTVKIKATGPKSYTTTTIWHLRSTGRWTMTRNGVC